MNKNVFVEDKYLHNSAVRTSMMECDNSLVFEMYKPVLMNTRIYFFEEA